MKIKSDFITNSSSSSFVVFGIGSRDLLNGIPDSVMLAIYDEYVSDYFDLEKVAKSRNSSSQYYANLYDEAISKKSDEEKIEGAKDLGFDVIIPILRELNEWKEVPFSWEEYYTETIGISPPTLLKRFPDTLVGDIKKTVANEFNEFFSVELTEDDIVYTEAGWYDG